MVTRHCICQNLVVLETCTRLVLVMHRREVNKTTNTGYLATVMMPETRVLIRGHLEAPPSYEGVGDETRQTILLFPTQEATPLCGDELKADGRPVTLVVPDGSWRQASKVTFRVPELESLPRRCLPAGPPSRYRLRREPHPQGLATFEAIARAMGIIEGEGVERAMMRAFDAMVDGTLETRYGPTLCPPGARS